MTFSIAFPNVDPVALEVGPVVIRWYALAYLVGLLLAWWYVRALAKRTSGAAALQDIDDFLVWATLGIILGGRLGYMLFYNFENSVQDPLTIFQIWRGGMSFHGGLIGVIVATVLFVRRRGIRLLPFADLIACAAPIGLFLGRIANFVNGELFGRASDVPWAVVFPHGGSEPRHPSQLYEASLEGLLLFVMLYLFWRTEGVRQRPGVLSGIFLVGYGVARNTVELFREPDAHIGFLLSGTTMGQWLSAPMILLGLYLIIRGSRRSAAPERKAPAGRSA
ncbi:MAG: prolipoprotein diacylglyceryl transferase [Rhodospirillales bacterium]|nr:prolipoprotein diacylglyceryl transferase [Rhodospirillales bacterium]